MSQQVLPVYNPRDRGRLNALRNIIAAVSDELRRQAPVAQGIVDFTTANLPAIIRRNTPFKIVSVDHVTPKIASPYGFEILDLINGRSIDQEVFSSVSELVELLDVNDLAAPLKGSELIGIDESQVDTPLPQSALSFLKSVAFRMYAQPDGSTDEAAGPLLSELRMQLKESEAFESENKLLSYIRNNYIAYVSALTALAFGRKPYVVLHGPLVRAIGPFSDISFDFRTASELLNINVPDAGEFVLPPGRPSPVVTTDAATLRNLPVIPSEAATGSKNLWQFNEFCLKDCGRKCATLHPFSNRKAEPPNQSSVTKAMIEKRDYPGYCLYFWILRSLVDLVRLAEADVTSVVEDVSAATEMSRFVLPSLLTIPAARSDIEKSSLKPVLKAVQIKYPSEVYRRRELYNQARRTIELLRIYDANVFSYILAEGQFTAPVQIYRYQPGRIMDQYLGESGLGTRDVFESILDTLFPTAASANHPGYRVMMSYLRTTPLREPIRVEYFDLPHLLPYKRAIGPVYLLSLPYQEYGLPIILYYADKLARTPSTLIRTIVEREYMDLVLQNRFSDPVSMMNVLGRLTRGYFQREGFR